MRAPRGRVSERAHFSLPCLYGDADLEERAVELVCVCLGCCAGRDRS